MKKENSQNTVSAKKSVKRTACLQPRKTLVASFLANLYLAHVIEQPNFGIPNPHFDQTVGRDILQFIY